MFVKQLILSVNEVVNKPGLPTALFGKTVYTMYKYSVANRYVVTPRYLKIKIQQYRYTQYRPALILREYTINSQGLHNCSLFTSESKLIQITYPTTILPTKCSSSIFFVYQRCQGRSALRLYVLSSPHVSQNCVTVQACQVS